MGWGRERTESAEQTEKLPRADSGGSIGQMEGIQ